MNNFDDTGIAPEEACVDDDPIAISPAEYARLKEIEAVNAVSIYGSEEQQRRRAALDTLVGRVADWMGIKDDPWTTQNLEYAAQIWSGKRGDEPSMATIPPENYKRLLAIEELARRAVTEQGDQLCWRDLYEGLGKLLGVGFDPQLLIRSNHLANCAHFVDCLYQGKGYEPPFAAAWSPTQCEEFWRAVLQWFQSMDTIFRADGGRGQDPKTLFSVMRCWREAFKLAGVLDHLGLPKVPHPPALGEAR